MGVEARRRLGGGLALLLALGLAFAEDEDPQPPFPAGTSTHELQGLQTTIVIPEGYTLAAEHSMIVILHGMGGEGVNMARSLQHLAQDDYVIVAPKSRGRGWDKKDVDDVRAITADLRDRLNIGKRRLHGVGFSNGGWMLGGLVLDAELRFSSGCWIAAGFQGGKLPKHAKKGMGIIALAGAQDGNRGAAEKTVDIVDGDVRMAEVRIQPKLGHKWPNELMPYYDWWVGVQEDRYVPGVTLAFDWQDDADAAPEAAKAQGTGSFCYWYAAADAQPESKNTEIARFFQNDVLQDRGVRFYGEQLVAWKRERSENEEAFAALGLKKTPAIVVHDRKGGVKKVLQGKIKPKSLAAALKSVAKVKKRPK